MRGYKDGKDEKLKNIIMHDRYRPHNDYSKIFIDGMMIEYEVQENFEEIERKYLEYDTVLAKSYTEIPDVKGMPGMDAMSLLENIGLKVKISGVGKVEHQSLEKGEKLIKGNTITLKLS